MASDVLGIDELRWALSIKHCFLMILFKHPLIFGSSPKWANPIGLLAGSIQGS
jgi:hypothetical protein